MITYKSPKYNNLSKKILEILNFNNIDTFDSESIIPKNVLDAITLLVQDCVMTSDKFLTEKCPKCGKTHLKIFNSSYSRNVIIKVNNVLIKVKLVVPRLICENCGSTHAVLPDFSLPGTAFPPLAHAGLSLHAGRGALLPRMGARSA